MENRNNERPPYQHSTLSEPIMHESQDPGAADAAKESYFTPSSALNSQQYGYTPASSQDGRPVPRQRFWKRRRFLIPFVLLIALIAGGVGGVFIGKRIEGNRHHDSDRNTIASAQASVCSSAAPTSPTSSSNPDAFTIPKTGCPNSGNHTFQTSFSNVTYKLFCNVNWIGSEIASVWAPTISDCVEACDTVNQYGVVDKSCMGTTFVPAWTNRTLAVRWANRPSNCFLKFQASGYPATEGPNEVVAMCLEGKCPPS